MTQATNASTMTRAPAATPAAPSPQRNRQRRTFSTEGLIRAGMATPQPPTGIQLNFHNLLDNLREEGPAHLITGVTDQSDLEQRADHLEAVLNAVTSYVKAVVGDAAYNANTKIPDETGFLVDAAADIVGALRNKADALAIEGRAA
jgi:hypothetical protein